MRRNNKLYFIKKVAHCSERMTKPWSCDFKKIIRIFFFGGLGRREIDNVRLITILSLRLF